MQTTSPSWSQALDLRDVVHVGHSTGGGEVTRYLGKHGTSRVKKAVLVSAIPPFMLLTESNPTGQPKENFDKVRAGVLADRTQFWKDLSLPFYGVQPPGRQGVGGSARAVRVPEHDGRLPCIVFRHHRMVRDGSDGGSKEDQRADARSSTAATIRSFLSPIPRRGLSKIIPKATLKVYQGAPHGLPTTHKDRLNQDLLAFLRT